MILTKRRRGLLVVALIVFLCGGGIVLLSVARRPVRLSFICLTNDVQIGPAGVFRLENHSKEAVETIGVIYQKRTTGGWSHHLNDYGARLGDATRLLPGAGSTFRVSVPTNGGPYRLVLNCVPHRTSKSPPPDRQWIVRLISWLPRSQPLIDRFVRGHHFPTSDPFSSDNAEQ
jgi:hypothetical protein